MASSEWSGGDPHSAIQRAWAAIHCRGTVDTVTREDLGLEPPPLDQTLADMIRWMVQAGHLPARFGGQLTAPDLAFSPQPVFAALISNERKSPARNPVTLATKHTYHWPAGASPRREPRLRDRAPLEVTLAGGCERDEPGVFEMGARSA
jgi:hypothetical protein